MGGQVTRIEIDVDDHGVAIVTMARAPVNAVNLVMFRKYVTSSRTSTR